MALFVVAPVALAAEDPALVEARKVYRDQVEPICKANTDANSKILKGVEGQVNSGKLVPAGNRFIRASARFNEAVKKIAAVPRPAAYTTTLKKWVDYLGEEKALLQKIGQSLKAEKENKARSYAVDLKRSNRKANETVLDFEFRYCEIDSSKFL